MYCYSGFGDQQIDLSCVSDLSLSLHNVYCVLQDHHGDSQRRNLSVSVCAVSGDSKHGNSKWRMAATAHWWARDDRQSLTQALRTCLLTSCCRPGGGGGGEWWASVKLEDLYRPQRQRHMHTRLDPAAQTDEFKTGEKWEERKRRVYHFSLCRRGNDE